MMTYPPMEQMVWAAEKNNQIATKESSPQASSDLHFTGMNLQQKKNKKLKGPSCLPVLPKVYLSSLLILTSSWNVLAGNSSPSSRLNLDTYVINSALLNLLHGVYGVACSLISGRYSQSYVHLFSIPKANGQQLHCSAQWCMQKHPEIPFTQVLRVLEIYNPRLQQKYKTNSCIHRLSSSSLALSTYSRTAVATLVSGTRPSCRTVTQHTSNCQYCPKSVSHGPQSKRLFTCPKMISR